MPTVSVAITINGTLYERSVPDDLPLLDFLQEDLGLTGTKLGCGIGVCRACTVAVRRVPTAALTPLLSCSTPAAHLSGQEVFTVEGLGDARHLSPLQKSFLDEFAFQCGYCAPGFLMAAHILLDSLRFAPVPRDQLDAAIADACGAHICRCTGYKRYYAAIRKAALAEPGLVS
ncbi:aerobic-type carbon monoxide dehydrogenase small subunit (CoxS/CutS family) [Azospirillum fermentarium]|uniref:(2Fe-2S)-binding protein n=1 Tax=Azospirillum fermentarium TaxID=1233114 RepID=UPI0022269C22|nr:(2Fe-2S)-binding protein [Azospirillum fermentarium]MCW2244850.1 aerobic-type carbon monoxide dehydrogenase small subunit (CoxS/CutS family) [Azospirillum fermentarium]